MKNTFEIGEEILSEVEKLKLGQSEKGKLK